MTKAPFCAHMRIAEMAPWMMQDRGFMFFSEEGETAGFCQTLLYAGTGSREKGVILKIVSE